MARPIPRDAPVTIATFPSSDRFIFVNSGSREQRQITRADGVGQQARIQQVRHAPDCIAHLRQRLLQVGDQVLRVLETYGNPHGSRAYARALQFFGAHIVVRAVDRKYDERLDAAKAGR